MLIAPAASPAAVNFGSNLTAEADNVSISCAGGGTCSLWNAALPTASTSNSLVAPISGVITGFTLKKSS